MRSVPTAYVKSEALRSIVFAAFVHGRRARPGARCNSRQFARVEGVVIAADFFSGCGGGASFVCCTFLVHNGVTAAFGEIGLSVNCSRR